MNISRKAWYVQLYFLMSWLNAKAFGRKGTIQDPTDLCSMLRMILIWGPLSIVWMLVLLVVLLACVLAVVGLAQLVVHSALTLTFVAFVLKVLKVIGTITGAVGIIALFGWLVEGIPVAFRMATQSALAERFRKRFPKREKSEPEPKQEKQPKSPSGLKIFFTWLDGKLHGWCSQLTLVD